MGKKGVGQGVGGGQPTKYDPDFHPSDFIEQSKKGNSLTQIACSWDVDRDTIYEWQKKHKRFSGACKRGKEYLEAWYTNIGKAAIAGQVKINGEKVTPNLGFFVWMTKNILKWSDKVENNIQPEESPHAKVVVQLPPKKKSKEEKK